MPRDDRTGAQAGVHEIHTESNVMVSMRDGVRLACDVYRPAKTGVPLDGAFPVLLQRTPYSKTREDLVLEAVFFTSHGYVTVLQDCRGRYGSEGGFTKYTAEGEDGYDTMEWLAKQPWHGGKVGTYGLSYSAHTQAAAATAPQYKTENWTKGSSGPLRKKSKPRKFLGSVMRTHKTNRP